MSYDPTMRGFCVVYHPESANHCPGCGRSNWHVGRAVAECAFCATALPLADSAIRNGGVPPAFTYAGGFRTSTRALPRAA